MTVCDLWLPQAKVNSKVICGRKFSILIAGLHCYCQAKTKKQHLLLTW